MGKQITCHSYVCVVKSALVVLPAVLMTGFSSESLSIVVVIGGLDEAVSLLCWPRLPVARLVQM